MLKEYFIISELVLKISVQNEAVEVVKIPLTDKQ